jgi:hypothetical protein
MPFLPPDVRISRHVQKLLTFGTSAKVDQVLERCSLVRDGESVHSRSGFLTDESCYANKQAVKEVFGETAYAFAKVNFVLAGCNCRDCAGP